MISAQRISEIFKMDNLETELEAELKFKVPINPYNAAETLEKDMRKNKEYFAGIPFEVSLCNVSLYRIGVSCRKQDKAKLKEILTKYFSRLKR